MNMPDLADHCLYSYDALGRRIVREQGSDRQVLLWWGNTEQSSHRHEGGQTTIQNDLQANPSESALNTVFARAVEGYKQDIQYFHKNYLDHVMAVSAANGNLLEHYRYTAFGEPEVYAPNGARLPTTAIANDILWNSRRYEPANGLYMYLYRDYDAASGRWPSRDPIAERGGVNLYGFCYNSPQQYFDSDGRIILPLIGIGLAGWGAFELGEALGELFIEAVESQESVSRRQEDYEEYQDDVSDPECPNDEIDESGKDYEESNREAMENADELGDAGGQVPGTGLQGPPAIPGPNPEDIIGEGLNRLQGAAWGE